MKKPTKEDVQAFFDTEFPDSKICIEALGDKKSQLRKPVTKSNLRPGKTVSGPFMMGLADAAIYAAIFSELGLVVQAATTNLSINFLRRPSADKDVLAKCILLKVGTRLIVGEVNLYSGDMDEPVAHAVGTFSIPAL